MQRVNHRNQFWYVPIKKFFLALNNDCVIGSNSMDSNYIGHDVDIT
jgi:hypothetical protein